MTSNNVVPLCVPNLGSLEHKWLEEALNSGFVSTAGPLISEFESAFADYVGAQYAVACSSGTTAIHVALHVLGFGPGDVLATSDFTFVASANPALHRGGSLSLIDSAATDWCMDPNLLSESLKKSAKVGRLPKVIQPVHILGQPADMGAILALAAEYEIPVVEDAAEGLGATCRIDGKAQHVGTLGDLGCYSFNGNKIMTTGGGGMIVTNDPALAGRARHLINQAKVDAPGYLHDEAGYNYRMTNLVAAVGMAQLERLPSFVEAKREIARRYNEAFADLPLSRPPLVAETESTYWLYSVLCSGSAERDGLASALEDQGLMARLLWRPLHQQPYMADAALTTNGVASELFSCGLSLPCSTNLTSADQERVIAAVRQFYTH